VLIEPYAGYDHSLPRLIAFAATAFPSLIAPLIHMSVSILITVARAAG